MKSISCLVNASSEIIGLKRSLVEGQQLQQKVRRKRKRKGEKKKKIRDVENIRKVGKIPAWKTTYNL